MDLHRFLPGLAWIHNLYLKACPGQAPAAGGRRPITAAAKAKGSPPPGQKQRPPPGRAVRGRIKERNSRRDATADHSGPRARSPRRPPGRLTPTADRPTAHPAIIRPVPGRTGPHRAQGADQPPPGPGADGFGGAGPGSRAWARRTARRAAERARAAGAAVWRYGAVLRRRVAAMVVVQPRVLQVHPAPRPGARRPGEAGETVTAAGDPP